MTTIKARPARYIALSVALFVSFASFAESSTREARETAVPPSWEQTKPEHLRFTQSGRNDRNRNRGRDRDRDRDEDRDRDRDRDRNHDEDREDRDDDKDKVQVVLTAPVNGALYAAPAMVRLIAAATAKQKNHPIVKVEFFAGTALVGTVPGPRSGNQYVFNWANVPAGSYTLVAKATNDKGDTNVSASAVLTVDATPTVSLGSPANLAVFTAPATIAVSANAADSDGTIAKVDFYQGTTLIGTAAAAPYTIGWANVQAGTYALTAKATDNLGLSATSAPITVIANAPPTVSLANPAAGASFNAPASVALTATAADADGTIVRVDFYHGTTPIGSAATAPFGFVWTNVAAGSYLLAARATDDRGAITSSAPVAISVNAPPTVSISSPASGAVLTAPATITIMATAADADGTVAKVDFFDGATLVGMATAAPYSVTLANAAPGSHSYTARATDNLGASTTSSSVSVVVNVPPSVSITSPANNSVVTAPANITVTAAATDSDGTVAKVDFYQGATLIGTATAAPYSATLANAAAGAYGFTAVATDNQGATAASAAVSVLVNAAPTVSITEPANNAVFAAPANITVSATAGDADGTVAKVDFFDGATPVGTVTAAPYSVTLANVAPGTHRFTAQATDNNGAVTTSAAVSVIVNVPPTVSITSPASGTVFHMPADITIAATAADTDGTVAKVDFYQGATLIGTATAAPYSFNWTNVAAGGYSLTAVATDDRGATATSAAVAITVNAPPAVSLTAPAAGAVFAAPAEIAVTANASDPEGAVAKVEFYQGTTLIGTATAAPYHILWSNVASGSYSLTAVATDAAGASTPSSAVAIRVNAAPTVSLTSPENGATFTAPASVNIAATAADSDGTIAKVEFYRGSTLITTLTAPPYNFTWTGVPQGSYGLTAVAADDLGVMATSAAVTIAVNAAVAQTYYIHPDHLNTPRLIADSTGMTVWRWDQGEPFGNDVPNNNPSGLEAFDFPLRFPGQYVDRELNTHYNVFRDYDPGIGRYVESDPIGLRGGMNTYAYVGSSPVGATDLLGLASTNGCGPEGHFYSKLIPNYTFAGCCDRHDNCYDDCKKKLTKYECDQDFHDCARDKCKGSAFVSLCQRIANTYGFGVGGYGGGAFNSARSKCPSCTGN